MMLSPTGLAQQTREIPLVHIQLQQPSAQGRSWQQCLVGMDANLNERWEKPVSNHQSPSLEAA